MAITRSPIFGIRMEDSFPRPSNSFPVIPKTELGNAPLPRVFLRQPSVRWRADSAGTSPVHLPGNGQIKAANQPA